MPTKSGENRMGCGNDWPSRLSFLLGGLRVSFASFYTLVAYQARVTRSTSAAKKRSVMTGTSRYLLDMCLQVTSRQLAPVITTRLNATHYRQVVPSHRQNHSSRNHIHAHSRAHDHGQR